MKQFPGRDSHKAHFLPFHCKFPQIPVSVNGDGAHEIDEVGKERLSHCMWNAIQCRAHKDIQLHICMYNECETKWFKKTYSHP